MATVNKNFRIKDGLIVEGTTGTINGYDIFTAANTTDDIAEGSTNLFFTAQRAADAVADEISTAVTSAVNALTTSDIEEGSNLYFTAQRAQDAGDGVFDAYGAAGAVASDLSDHINDTSAHGVTGDVVGTSDAQDLSNKTFLGQTNFQSGGGAGGTNNYINVDNNGHMTVRSGYELEIESQNNVNITSNGGDIVLNADGTSYLTSVASGNEIATRGYVDGLAGNYDAAGAAATAEGNANDYTDTAISGLSTVYDAYGAASTAQSSANSYTDTALESYTPTSGLDSAVGGYGYIKSADLSGYATESYVGTAIDNLVDGAPALLDTLNEIAAAINNDANYATTLTTALSNKQDTLTAGTGITLDGATVSVTANTYDAYGAAATAEGNANDYTDTAISGLSTVYDALGAASTAETNAKSYADDNFVTLDSLPGQLDNYVPTSEKGAALGVATLDASGYVPASQLNIDVTGDITTAINALTTDDIEEGSTNLYFTASRAVDALEAVVPNFEEIDVNSIAKQIAATASVTGSTSNSVYTFRNASYKSAKFLVKVTVGSDTEVSEVLLVTDSSGNIAITEYANVASNASLSSITASYVGGSFISLDVTPTGNGTVKVFGTLLV